MGRGFVGSVPKDRKPLTKVNAKAGHKVSSMRANFLCRLVTEASIAVAVVGGSLFASSAVAGASTEKNTAFCTAESYISHTAVGGEIAPSQWKTVDQEKATLKRVDNDLALAVTDAPTEAFAVLAKELVGIFSGWIDDPKLLSQEAKRPPAGGSSSRFSMSSRLFARMAMMADVTASGDYIWPIYAACPEMARNGKADQAFGKPPPKWLATPVEVAATGEAFGAMIGSRLMSTTAFNRPSVTSMRIAVARIDSKYPGRDIVLIGLPTLLDGVWHAEYRLTTDHQRFDVFVSQRDSSDPTDWPRISDVVAVSA